MLAQTAQYTAKDIQKT